MDQLLQQLAQTLKIPNDALQTILNNYPKLRQEYVIYHSLYCIRLVTVVKYPQKWCQMDTLLKNSHHTLFDTGHKIVALSYKT